MVGYADTKIGTFSWNEEMLAYTTESYGTEAFWEHLDIEVPIEYDDVRWDIEHRLEDKASDEFIKNAVRKMFVGLVINHIKEKVNA